MGYMDDMVVWLRARLERPAIATEPEMSTVLRMMAVWRSRVIANALVRNHGAVILQGPFAGMAYVAEASEGALAPRLLGSYESELHPHIEAFARRGVDNAIVVGCAEGYYAAGLARLMPGARVYAYDIQEKARAGCAELVARNGVADRVTIRETFLPADFDQFEGRCLVFMDVEGAEDDLLQPALSPSLARMDVIVETHDLYRPGVLDRIRERFAATHDIARIDQQPKTTPMPDWLQRQSHLDQLLAVWEFRARPTPWLVMTPKG